MIAYHLTLENVPFRTHSIVGLYELPGETGVAGRIACIHFAMGFVEDWMLSWSDTITK